MIHIKKIDIESIKKWVNDFKVPIIDIEAIKESVKNIAISKKKTKKKRKK